MREPDSVPIGIDDDSRTDRRREADPGGRSRPAARCRSLEARRTRPTTRSATPSPPAGCTCSVWSSTWQPASHYWLCDVFGRPFEPPSIGRGRRRATRSRRFHRQRPRVLHASAHRIRPSDRRTRSRHDGHHRAWRHRVVSMGDPPHDRRNRTPCRARRPHTRTYRQHHRLSAPQEPPVLDRSGEADLGQSTQPSARSPSAPSSSPGSSRDMRTHTAARTVPSTSSS